MKIFFRNIHLYLSLAAGLVIMTCCFTGAVLVFEKELQEALNHDRYFVKQQNLQLPIEQLVSSVKQKFPTAKISSVKIYPAAERSVEIGISMPQIENRAKQGGKEASKSKIEKGENKVGAQQKGKAAAAPAGGGRPSHTVFVNPYSGEILELYSYRETFFYTMFSLHRWLLGGDDSIGKIITGVSTLIFLFILLTGIILWWPRNKAILKQRLKIKTGASWKRLNHDFHIVLGFYSSIFLFIFAFTALAWSFKWFNDGIYTVTKTSPKQPEAPHSVFVAGKAAINYDSAFIKISKKVQNVQFYTLRAPTDSVGIFSASVLPIGAHESASDNYYIDQYTGEIIGTAKFSDKNLGQRVRSTFKPVHVGSIYGLPSKILAFIVCLLGVTFPITGTIMWLNRLKKNKKKAKIPYNSKVLEGVNEDDLED
jgi:uncharacterized iron-regulated membrane protein